jgi:hypothetical protein
MTPKAKKPSTVFDVGLCFALMIVVWSLDLLWFFLSARSPAKSVNGDFIRGFYTGCMFVLVILWGLIFGVAGVRHWSRVRAARPAH